DRSCIRSVQGELGQPVLRHLYDRARLFHLPAQGLHLRDVEAGIVRDNHHLGVLEDTIEGRYQFLFGCSIHRVLNLSWLGLHPKTAPCALFMVRCPNGITPASAGVRSRPPRALPICLPTPPPPHCPTKKFTHLVFLPPPG